FEADGRLGLVDLVAIAQHVVEAAGNDLDELLADDSLGADRRDGIFLHRNVFVDTHGDDGFVAVRIEFNAGDETHTHARGFHDGTTLRGGDAADARRQCIARLWGEAHAASGDGGIGKGCDAKHYEEACYQLDVHLVHARVP